MAALLALGADGVLLGTRFVATVESEASDLWKRRLVDDRSQTTLTDGFTGQWARVLESDFTLGWAASGTAPLPGLLQATAGADLFGAAKKLGDDQFQPLYAGTGAILIDDLPSAGTVVERVVAEARSALDQLR